MGLDIEVRRRTSDYDFSIRQSIEIARACLVPREVLGIEAPVILLDEPTSALAMSEEEAFFRELLELIGLSHRIAVMRAGRVTAILHAPPDKKPTERELVGLMLGTYSGVP
jgi:ribose transport system ATP-binding protein